MIDEKIGIVWPNQGPYIRGIIKNNPEDFIVEEIDTLGNVYTVEDTAKRECSREGDQLIVKLIKKNWDTLTILKKVAKELHIGQNRIAYAGTKDKIAITSQRISIWNVKPEDIEKIHIPDVRLMPLYYSKDRLKLGDLWGNRFTITIHKVSEEDYTNIDRIISRTAKGVPNFFGPQRFGSQRCITHIIGQKIIQGDLEGAVYAYICEERDPALKEAMEDNDYSTVKEMLPTRAHFERTLIEYLIMHPRDYAGAIHKLPRKLQKLFIHAAQAYEFNKELSSYISKKEEPPTTIKLPPIQVKRMPYLSERGIERETMLVPQKMQILQKTKDDVYDGFNKIVLTFNLIKGAYATVVLRDIIGEFQ